MASKANTGVHIVPKRLADGTRKWYVYAWRSGPQILTTSVKPRLTPELIDLAYTERQKLKATGKGQMLADQIIQFKASPEFLKTAASTQANYRTWLDRISEEFGDTTLKMWEKRTLRGDVLAWRNQWAHQPRSADEAVRTFSRLLNWIHDQGRLSTNVLAGIGQLYDNNRSDLIWEEKHFDQFRPHASVEVMEGVNLAASTGLRRGDLVRLPWIAIQEHAIVWQTSKSRGKNIITIPLLPEVRTLIERIKLRHSIFMAQQRPNRRKPLPETVLSNSRWEPWEPGGFGSRFNDAKQASKLDRNLHDLRGTFATRCMKAGLSDEEIANILGWSSKEVSVIRTKYVNDARIAQAIGERIAGVKA